MRGDFLNIIAIVPILERKEKLSHSLSSIQSQTESPSRIIVVYEREEQSQLMDNEGDLLLTENLRTKNLSGAINHAVDEILMRRNEWNINLESTWLALLEDDDWWEPEYIENCIRMIENDIHQVVCGLVRYDEKNPNGVPTPIPEHLEASSFLIENPNIQGSNMFVRMDAFLEAGGFDESLYSCADRDFFIRLFEGTNHKWARIERYLVHHDARDSGRISDRGSARKLQGLRRFAMKHQFIMNDDEWREFHEVSTNKFGLITTTEVPNMSDYEEQYVVGSRKWESVRKLTVGVTLGSEQLARRFIQSFSNLVREFSHQVKLVICLHEIALDEIEPIIEKSGLDISEVVVREEEWGHTNGKGGKLGPWFLRKGNRKGVSWGRCVLHYAIWLETKLEGDPLIWILDDDIIFESTHLEQISYIANDMLSKGISVGIGHIVGDPPLIPIYTVRGQLIDFYYANLSKQNPYRNRVEIEQFHFHEMHHDLSTARMDHLEFPIGFYSAMQTEIDIEEIMSGKSVTRKVHCEWRKRGEIPTRGGNTLLLDSSLLIKWPNMAPNCGGIQFRRGDSLWTQWIALDEPNSICSVPLTVLQDRLTSKDSIHSFESIRGDIAGSMLVRAIRQVKSMSEIPTSNIANGVINESKLREARLISNLIRVKSLMWLNGIEQRIIMQIENLTSILIRKKWPESITDELETFLHELGDSIEIFNRVHEAEQLN